MTLLLISILVLALGPILGRLLEGKAAFNEFIDGFVLISIGGIAMLHLLPEAFMHIGLAAFVMAALGALLPVLVERAFERRERVAHSGVVFFALSGILLHTLLDGMALSEGSKHHHGGELLALAVVLHRLPVGLLIWWALRPLFSNLVVISVLVIMSLSTLAGYLLGSLELHWHEAAFPTYFQSLVTGSLLHVLFHRDLHDHGAHGHALERRPRGQYRIWASSGALLAVVLLSFLPLGEDLPEAHSLSNTLNLALSLALKTSPALLLGFTIAASIQLFVPEAGLGWLKSKSRARRVTRGMLFGLPLPICSCGVVPLYHSLIRRGVPMGAAMAFFIATPELGIDAVLISVPLLGWKMTLVRLLAAAIIAWLGAYIMDRLVPAPAPTEIALEEVQDATDQQGALKRFWKTLNHELVDELAPWIILGLLIAAVMDPFLGNIDWSTLPSWVDIPLMAIIGMPLYVCATGATPIAAVMLMNGVSPGAVLAFLITGPATNFTTIGILRQLHGNRVAILFPLVIITLTITVGFIVNGLIGGQLAAHAAVDHHEHSRWYEWASGAILIVLVSWSLIRIGPRGMLGNIFEGLGDLEEDDCCDDGHKH